MEHSAIWELRYPRGHATTKWLTGGAELTAESGLRFALSGRRARATTLRDYSVMHEFCFDIITASIHAARAGQAAEQWTASCRPFVEAP
jgi:hypothetical protein